jgi:hypothetical protein
LIVAALTEKAMQGNAQAAKEWRELGVLTPQTSDAKNDRGLLALLTPDQRACIHAALRGETVHRDLALDAWVR